MNEGEDQSARQPHSGTPFGNVVPIERMAGDDEEDTALLKAMGRQATEYLMSFDWCVSIVDTYFGDGIRRNRRCISLPNPTRSRRRG
jgi:hypothetical protein